MTILRGLSLAFLVLFSTQSKAETTMQLRNGQACLGHFTLMVAPELVGGLTEIQITYDLTTIKYSGTMGQDEYDAFVRQREATFAREGAQHNPARQDTVAGPLFKVRQTVRGGTFSGIVRSGDAVFETATLFSDRMADEFAAVATDVMARIRAASTELPANAVFCFADGYIVGPVAAPTRAKSYRAVAGTEGTLRFEIISEWLAKPEIGMVGQGSARNVGGTQGVEVRLRPDEGGRDGGFVLLPPAGGARYYEGISENAPGLRLRPRLWNDDPAAEAINEDQLDEVWDALLNSVRPLPALRDAR